MKRKGKGRGKGSRKKRRHLEEGLQGEEPKRGEKGEKAKAKEAAKAAAEMARRAEELRQEEERRRAAARRAKPGFSKLLEAMGVQNQSEDEEDEDEDEEDEDQDEDGEDADEEDTGPKIGEAVEGKDADEDDEEGEQEVLDEDFEDEADEPDEPDEPDELENDEKEEEGLDFFPRFWESTSSSSSSSSSRFSLPGLGRCEAHGTPHGCTVEALVKSLESGLAGHKLGEVLSSAWSHFRLAPGLREAFQILLDALRDEKDFKMGPEEGAFFLCLHAYLDVSFPQHSHLNARALRALYALHIVDHLRKVRGEDKYTQGEQGFTRARVLVLCPFRSVCHDLVKLLLALLMPKKKQVAHMQRFEEEFGTEEEVALGSKPVDYQHLFGGNSDDRFRIGLALWKKGVRLYAPFNQADILICSPLGLRQITGAEGERKRDFDFLSSIEVCVIDRADVLRMQNWEHVQEVMQVVNQKPRGLGSIDISCLRAEFADGRAREFRQTVVTSCGQCLDAEALFKLSGEPSAAPKTRSLASRLRAPQLGRKGRSKDFDAEEEDIEEGMPLDMLKTVEKAKKDVSSCRGIAKLAILPEGEPLRQATALGISRQFFLHTPCGSLAEQSNSLFETFETRYWRPLGHSLEGLLVIATNYYNFLRLRRFLREEGASFSSIFEYSSAKVLGHARQQFFRNERRVLLVTERFLWYRRFRLRGANYVLFYGVPQTPEIYEEVLGAVRVPSQCNSMCLFTRHDAFALERIVGHERAKKMLTSAPGKVFVYS